MCRVQSSFGMIRSVRLMACKELSLEEVREAKLKPKSVEHLRLCMNCHCLSLDIIKGKRNEYVCTNCGKNFAFMMSNTGLSGGTESSCFKEGLKNG